MNTDQSAPSPSSQSASHVMNTGQSAPFYLSRSDSESFDAALDAKLGGVHGELGAALVAEPRQARAGRGGAAVQRAVGAAGAELGG